jgi:hypothetical protein
MVRRVEPIDSVKLQALGWLRTYDCQIGIKYLAIQLSCLQLPFSVLVPADDEGVIVTPLVTASHKH